MTSTCRQINNDFKQDTPQTNSDGEVNKYCKEYGNHSLQRQHQPQEFIRHVSGIRAILVSFGEL